MKYYISDLHFFHRNIYTLDYRDFETLFDMHDSMIKNWNEKVTDNDEVYIVGDLSFGNGSQTWEVLNKLNGTLILIEGNHDNFYLDDPEFVDIFDYVCSYMELQDQQRKVILSHYPMPFYNGQFYKDNNSNYSTYMLYGHVHNTYDEYLLNHAMNFINSQDRTDITNQIVQTPQQMINVFCCFSNYQPMSLDEWIVIDKKRRQLINKWEADYGSLDYEKWQQLNHVMIQQGKKQFK